MMSKLYAILGVKGVVVLVFLLISSATAVGTSTDTFCLSCHEMRIYRDELLLSPHAKDAKGHPIGCSQCHIPNSGVFSMLGAKTYMGAKDAWAHFNDEDPAVNRNEMREDAREFIADSNCRTCHEDLMLNAKGDGPVPDKGRKDHATYLKNNPHADRGGCSRCHGRKPRSSAPKKPKVEIKSCVSCHEGLAHKPFHIAPDK